MSSAPVTVRQVSTTADRKAFVDFAFSHNKADPNWVPPLKTEVHGLIDPRTNPWFEHAEARLFLAERDGEVVGRISAQVDDLAVALGEEQAGLGMLEPGIGAGVDQPVPLGLERRHPVRVRPVVGKSEIDERLAVGGILDRADGDLCHAA